MHHISMLKNCRKLLLSCFLIPSLSSCGLGSSEQDNQPMVISTCLGTNFPASTELSLIGVDEAAGDSGTSKTVSVNAGFLTNPQILVLSGGEAITWDFSDFPEDKILGVITYGHSPQKVANLPSRVPLKQLSYENRKTNPPHCGLDFSTNEGGPELDRVVEQVERVTGLKVTRFKGAEEASSISVSGNEQVPAEEPDHMAESGPFAGIDTRERPDTWPGVEAVAALVADGSLRVATQTDIDEWNEKATAALKSGHLAAFKAENLERPHAYVVLKSIKLPEQKFPRSFIIPIGIEIPGDNSKFGGGLYFMETGTCGGQARNCPGERVLPFGSHPDARSL